jgi:chemotaxis protein MotB
MALNEEPDEGGGVPEWVVTFGDMMSLLLTFFIMLVSLSEIKEQEKYQAMVDSIRRQFGHDRSLASLAPGKQKPRNSRFVKIDTMGRAQVLDTHEGGDRTKAPVGDFPSVRIIRPGSRTAVGTVVHFRQASAQLGKTQQAVLAAQAEEMIGKPQKIEIRGHTSFRPPAPDSPFQDNWDLAYQRCRAAMDLLARQGIQPQRMRLAVAGPYEPVHLGTAPDKLLLNPRVEVHLLDESWKDLEGTPSPDQVENPTETPPQQPLDK